VTTDTVSRRDAAIDVAIVVSAVGAAWAITRLALYPALGIPDHYPAILRPIFGFIAATALLMRRRQGWASLGLRMPSNVVVAVIGAIVLYAVNWALTRWAVPMIAEIFQPRPQPSFLAPMRGNPAALLLWLAIGWIVGGFMEELLFRGFLLTRVSQLFADARVGLAIGVVAQAILFGLLHFYGGGFALIFATVLALASGVFYLLLGRNLWPLIAVHGAWNSVAMWGVYSS
jgi:membrane protease YdiL (CAAX protease family)